MEGIPSFGTNELRIIGHAINWVLNGPYEHTAPPSLSEQERDILGLLLGDVCRCLSDSGSANLAVAEPYSCTGGQMRLPPARLRLITDAVASFSNELRSSPVELEVVTGLPPSKTTELLSRLRGIYPPPICDAAHVS